MIKREFNTLNDFLKGVEACEVLELPYFHSKQETQDGTFWIITIKAELRNFKY